MIEWQKYLSKDLLKRQSPNFGQIGKQILRAGKDLQTFYLVVDEDPEWASTIAYQAMLRMGRALLFSHGYLPTNRQQHKTVVGITGNILGPEFNIIAKQFNRLRKKRNVFFYDSEDAHNLTEAKKAIEVAKELFVEIKKKIKSANPQQEFEF
jgi:uncharacterized protein (UPF0332 family)